jgi:membrane fusion protein (multidrug efflux system)
MSKLYLQKMCFLCVLALGVVILAAGCGNRQAQGPAAVAVKAMQVIQRDTPVTYEYVGQVEAKNEVKIISRVSGNITAKMVTGGTAVVVDQPLFQIDRRQYTSAVLAAQGNLAKAEAAYSNARLESVRYRQLGAQQAVSQQIVDNALAAESQNAAQVDACRAQLQQAENDLHDTVIVSPVNGRIDMNDLSVGSFVQAGSTVLATVSTVDPVLVKFSMSENEYLRLSRVGRGSSPADWGLALKLVLSDGSPYPLDGKIEQVDRGLTQDTGTLTLKAVFDNPQKLLVPGMFARVTAQGEVRPGALLIPQRAVQELLGKTFVTVVAEGNKAEMRPVKMGPRIGDLWIVEEGLTAGDCVVVEGGAKVAPGTPLKVEMLGPENLQTVAKQ